MIDPPDPNSVIAVLTADVHWSHRAPVFRSNEPDWYKAQERAWEQVNILADERRCPIIIAGDLFNTWREPHQLITWAMRMLGCPTFAIPGNHDLPGHSYIELHRSAYGVLVEAGKLGDIPASTTMTAKVILPGLILHGFPCGFPVKPCTEGNISPFGVRLAVIHEYVWTKKHGYPGAPPEQRLGKYLDQIEGYDAVLFGDNHNGFLAGGGDDGTPFILNAGCLMRRRADEINYKPAVGLLYGDGSIQRHYLDISDDKFLTPEEMVDKAKELSTDFTEFLKELEGLGASALDFLEVVEQSLKADPPTEDVKATMLGILERVKNG